MMYKKYKQHYPLLSFIIVIVIIFSSFSVYALDVNIQDNINEEKNEKVRIAVIDTGISLRAVTSASVIVGKNFALPKYNTSDRNGHGSMVASVIHDTAPEAELVPLVWYDRYASGIVANGGATAAALAIISAVDDYNCDIINISSGITSDIPVLREAVEYAVSKGAIVVSAVGNANLSNSKLSYYPACYDGVIGVGSCKNESIVSGKSINTVYTVSAFSQRNGVDVVAAGERLTSRTLRGAKTYVSGTSYSCAYVSAYCANLIAENPECSSAEIIELLYSEAIDICEKGYDCSSGWGVLR